MPEVAGVVTADSDGQHSVEAICNIKETLLQMPDHLVLGVRDFGKEGIPWKSRFGNNLTEKVFAYLSGVHVSDTQTGSGGYLGHLWNGCWMWRVNGLNLKCACC